MKDFDLIIGHGIVGKAEADILEKPFITLSIETMGLQKEYWKSKNIVKETGLFLSDKIKGALFGKPYLRFCNDVNEPAGKSTGKYPYLAIIPMPPFLQKPNRNWKNSTKITGFLFAETPNEYAPPEDLISFISKGEKPILITFGSMFHNQEQTQHLFQIVWDTLMKLKTTAILIMPDLDEKETEIPENIFLAKQIPYSWLLNQVS